MIKLEGNLAVCCTSFEDAKVLLRYLCEVGYEWAGTNKDPGNTNWSKYEAETVYFLNSNKRIQFANREYLAETTYYRIVSINDILHQDPASFYRELINKKEL